MNKKKKIINIITKKEVTMSILLEKKIRMYNKEKLYYSLPFGWYYTTNHVKAFLGRIWVAWNPTIWEVSLS